MTSLNRLPESAPSPDDENVQSTTADHANQDSIVDTLGKQIGVIPWWAVSGAFHLIALVLFILMMTDIPHENQIVAIQSLPTPQEKTILEDPPPPPTPPKDLKDPQITLDQTSISEIAPIMVEVVPIEDITQTDDNAITSEAKGDPNNKANVNLGDSGLAMAMGVGPGGGPAGQKGDYGPGGHRRAVKKYGGNIQCISAVDLALEWLAKHQEPDGHWDTVKYGAQESGRCDTAATGLAALAFLGGGHSTRRGMYKDNVKRALEWMIKQQNADGCIMPGANGKEASYGPGYHHAICGIALSEGYGMDKSAWLKDAAQKAVNYSCDKHQDGTGSDKLGWRYAAKSAGDISVSGWFIMQLKDARMCQLAVPQDAFQGGIAFLDSLEIKADPNDPYSGHRYKYTVNKPEATPMQTMIGCTARMFLGWPKEELEPAVRWATEKKGLPRWGNNGDAVDWYYLYYGTIVSFQMGGDLWAKWRDAFSPMLLDNQRRDGDEKGSWDPTGHYANLGRVFSTANGALSLEVFWRISPLYANSGRQ